MLHPLIRLATDRPQWLAEHLLAYGELAGDELGLVVAQWQRRLAWQLAAAALAVIAALLGGIAMLLWAATPGIVSAPLALVLVPAGPALLAALCALAARGGPAGRRFAALRAQLDADLQWLRDVEPA